MNVRIVRQCKCGRQLVSRYTWRRATMPERDEMRANNIREHLGRGMCRTCWERVNYHGNLAEHERLSRDNEDVLAEWHHVDLNREMPRARRIALVAPRLGMTETALERALYRAKARGEQVA